MSRTRGWLAFIVCSLVTLAANCANDLPPEGGLDTASSERVANRVREPSSLGSHYPVRVVDDAGTEVVFEQAPTRVLSLVPSVTDILLALGQADRLIGRTDYDRAEEVRHLPSVGGGLRPSMERIVALEPDIVIRFRGESDPDTPRQLDAWGVPSLAIRPDRVDDIRRIIGVLGTMVGEPERADSLRGVMDGELRAVSQQVRGAPTPRIVFLGGDPPSVAGPGTFLHELVVFAGGENVFGDLRSLYSPVSLEEILRRDVDLILAPEATPLPTGLGGIQVRLIPLDVLNPGLQVGRSARTIGAILHPDRF